MKIFQVKIFPYDVTGKVQCATLHQALEKCFVEN